MFDELVYRMKDQIEHRFINVTNEEMFLIIVNMWGDSFLTCKTPEGNLYIKKNSNEEDGSFEVFASTDEQKEWKEIKFKFKLQIHR